MPELTDKEKNIIDVCFNFLDDVHFLDNISDVIGEDITQEDMNNLLNKLLKEKKCKWEKKEAQVLLAIYQMA